MEEIRLIVEYHENDDVVFAELHEASKDSEFVYTDEFKIALEDTEVETEGISSVWHGEYRFVKLSADDKKENDPRFIWIK